ncbi:MAG: NAD(P)/FAD-dependent oxidoreductase [Chloroflexota bacterium]
MTSNNRPKVVIIGAGFGGLFAARALAKQAVDVLLIDRNNYHTFTPLLYQVATCALDPSEIAYPIRSTFRGTANIQILLGTVTAIDSEQKSLSILTDGLTRQESYDELIIATGSVPTYFGNDLFRAHAFEMRTLQDSLKLRNHILKKFEKATWSNDPAEREALTTIVVVGGGPTGLETAGAIYELYNHVLSKEYTSAKTIKARVVLVEMLPHLLAPYPDKLRQAALEQLQSLGVEVILENPVKTVEADYIILGDGQKIATHTLVWTAGVRASPVGEMLNVELTRSGQIPILATTAVIGHANIYAVGDIAYLEDGEGRPYPMLIPVAIQQGEVAATNILHQQQGQVLTQFSYHDRGIMATIGRRRAVAWIFNRIPLQGFIAWVAWLGLHLMTLMGFRNQLNVLINWVWNYLTYDRSVRIIWGAGSVVQDE